MKYLLSPLSEGISLKNRVVMAPMTRSRSTSDHIPESELMATYYRQRAGAGLLITEGTAPSANGVGYARIPGIYNDAQVEAWKPVTAAVHEEGSKIFMQLMHTGRVSHPDNMPEGAVIMSASAIVPANTQMYVDGKGMLAIPAPKEMSAADIENTIEEYVTASQNAINAGFDGIELHAANGYLLEQFISPSANQRTDEYGGTAENRSRFVLEVTRRVVEAIGKDKVGIRLSPNGAFNDIAPFAEQKETFDHLAEKLNELDILYIHLVNHGSMGAPALPDDIRDSIREKFKGLLILSGGYDNERAEKDLAENNGDLVAFGRPLLTTPDLIERWKTGAPLNEPKMDFFYTPGPEGYTDYPTLESTKDHVK